MINNLHVRNLALIDEANICFHEGLNILTGETGAGKSIIIGALGLALGDRADSDAIRAGADSGLVELTITDPSPSAIVFLKEQGIDTEDGSIIIKRRILPGRSECRVNGESVTLKELSALTSRLIDICGQRESLSLLKETALSNMLDSLGGNELSEVLVQIKNSYKEYRNVLSSLNEIDEDEALRKRKADLAEYELNEIDEAHLESGECDELEAEYRRLSHSARINEALSIILQMCGSDEGASGLLSQSLRELRSVVEYDDTLSGLESQLYDLESQTNDLVHEIRSYLDANEYDAETFNSIQERLNLYNRLKDKYGSSVEQILTYRDQVAADLEKYQNHDQYIASLYADKERLYNELLILCEKAHNLRTEAASVLTTKLLAALTDMNFIDCRLEVVVNADSDTITATGYDHIDFLISMNPGEPLKPLNSVASGGELSRIMLAIKCVTGDRDQIDSMVFDEIDTGISGITAWKVGEKMRTLAGTHQLICITHQAQIAAQADTHFLIGKHVEDGRTLTTIEPLSRPDMIKELARMTGSDIESPAALSAAEELKTRAGK